MTPAALSLLPGATSAALPAAEPLAPTAGEFQAAINATLTDRDGAASLLPGSSPAGAPPKQAPKAAQDFLSAVVLQSMAVIPQLASPQHANEPAAMQASALATLDASATAVDVPQDPAAIFAEPSSQARALLLKEATPGADVAPAILLRGAGHPTRGTTPAGGVMPDDAIAIAIPEGGLPARAMPQAGAALSVEAARPTAAAQTDELWPTAATTPALPPAYTAQAPSGRITHPLEEGHSGSAERAAAAALQIFSIEAPATLPPADATAYSDLAPLNTLLPTAAVEALGMPLEQLESPPEAPAPAAQDTGLILTAPPQFAPTTNSPPPSGVVPPEAPAVEQVRSQALAGAQDGPPAKAPPVEGGRFEEALRLADSGSPPPSTEAQPGAARPPMQGHFAGAATLATSAPPAAAPPAHPTVTGQPGRIGYEMGVEVARTVTAGQDELTIRLNPIEMGRIEVKLSFDDGGSLRAVVAAENPAALDMLRRDSADLNRALSDAGIRSDAQSFRFDSRSSNSGEGGQFWQRQQQASQSNGRGASTSSPSSEDPIYRPLRTSGQVDLMA